MMLLQKIPIRDSQLQQSASYDHSQGNYAFISSILSSQ